MKNQIFLIVGLILSFLGSTTYVAHAEPNPSLTVDIQGDYVSFDDVTTALSGTMTESEEGRTYEIDDQIFWLDHGKGYSLVNNQPEPLLVEASSLNPNLSVISYTTPILFNDELFVPIGYVERLFSFSYENGDFEHDGEVILKGEVFVETTDTETSITEESDEKSDEKSESSSTPEVNVIEKNPTAGEVSTQTPTTVEKLTVKRIFVNQSRVSVKVGETAKVNAVVDPFNVEDASITWSSENSGIATVDNNGNIKGVKEGTVTLTVQSNMNPSAKASVVVTVTPPPTILATSIHIDKTSLSLEVGQTSSVSAWVSPDNTTNKGITWSSENSAIATVDGNGMVTAKGEGTTRLVATSSSNPELKAHVSVTVKAKPVAQAPTPAPTPDKVETPEPEPAPQPQPVFTGTQVINQLASEGFYVSPFVPNTVFWSDFGPDIDPSLYDVSITAVKNSNTVDLSLTLSSTDWDTCFAYTRKALNKVIPSGTSTIINAVSNVKSGTWTFDGRTVSVRFGNGYVAISISPK